MLTAAAFFVLVAAHSLHVSCGSFFSCLLVLPSLCVSRRFLFSFSLMLFLLCLLLLSSSGLFLSSLGLVLLSSSFLLLFFLLHLFLFYFFCVCCCFFLRTCCCCSPLGVLLLPLCTCYYSPFHTITSYLDFVIQNALGYLMDIKDDIYPPILKSDIWLISFLISL